MSEWPPKAKPPAPPYNYNQRAFLTQRKRQDIVVVPELDFVSKAYDALLEEFVSTEPRFDKWEVCDAPVVYDKRKRIRLPDFGHVVAEMAMWEIVVRDNNSWCIMLEEMAIVKSNVYYTGQDVSHTLPVYLTSTDLNEMGNAIVIPERRFAVVAHRDAIEQFLCGEFSFSDTTPNQSLSKLKMTRSKDSNRFDEFGEIVAMRIGQRISVLSPTTWIQLLNARGILGYVTA